MNIRVGDMVVTHSIEFEGMLGVVVGVKVMEGIWKDTSGMNPMYSCTVLWDRDVPSWMGSGRLCDVTDSVLVRVENEKG